MQTNSKVNGSRCSKCGGLSVLTNDPRFSINCQAVTYFHCINCGKTEFIKQVEPTNDCGLNVVQWNRLVKAQRGKHIKTVITS